MLRKSLIALAIIMFASAVMANDSTAVANSWKIDNTHSSFGFEVSHLVIGRTRGQFNDFEGTVIFDGKDLASASVTATIKTASIDTDDEDRDNHLRSDDFFSATEFPEMTLVSTKITPGEGTAFTITADLTIKGVTKEVIFDCEFYGVIDDPWGNLRAGFSATAKINRQDFNVNFSKALDSGGLVVGNEVTISLEVEMVKPKKS